MVSYFTEPDFAFNFFCAFFLGAVFFFAFVLGVDFGFFAFVCLAFGAHVVLDSKPFVSLLALYEVLENTYLRLSWSWLSTRDTYATFS